MRLAAPIEIRPVLHEYLTCPAHLQTVPAAQGPDCFRLGSAALVVHRLQGVSVVLQTLANGSTATDRRALDMQLTAHDTTTFAALTAALLHKQVAFVVGGKVQSAPFIQGHITIGIIQIPVDGAAAQALVSELTG